MIPDKPIHTVEGIYPRSEPCVFETPVLMSLYSGQCSETSGGFPPSFFAFDDGEEGDDEDLDEDDNFDDMEDDFDDDFEEDDFDDEDEDFEDEDDDFDYEEDVDYDDFDE